MKIRVLAQRFSTLLGTMTVLATPSLAKREASSTSRLPLLLDSTLDELQTGLKEGHFTSIDLVRAYIARIGEVNHELRAVLEINPDAEAIAWILDVERQRGRLRSPLHGIPVLVKDNIATYDGMNTTAGSFALLGANVGEDSTVAAKLRKAGAIILGKTNMSQWAGLRSINCPMGWSARGGQTVGAYFPGHNPQGSSSGSAVAASIGLAWASIGTETTSSLVGPAHANNIVGIKPTVGLTSRHLVIPLSRRWDSVGPMARTVKDAAYLLDVMAGRDDRDNYTSMIPFQKLPSYVDACRPGGLRGKRIGVLRNFFDIEARPDPSTLLSLAAFEKSLKMLTRMGAEVVDDIRFEGLKEYAKTPYHFVCIASDLKDQLYSHYFRHLKTNPHGVSSLQDLRRFVQETEAEEYPRHDTSFFDWALSLDPTETSASYKGNNTFALEQRGLRGVGVLIRQHSLDALFMPSVYAGLTSSLSGSPAITVPLGASPIENPYEAGPNQDTTNIVGPNHPFGVGFVGSAFSEESLIAMAYAFEQHTRVRQTIRPWIKPRTELDDIVRPRLFGRS
ncbi:glutamyl-tRNA(Gln) amidotransferase subunit A [Ophiocordyceps camponoti-floridani]|uniref:Glutamyl-tRNA(Gln) amidotransferase subunit A n=1 Tax=Ophiocordyceps camponoti-floridani TaxID=2030778 RepID=A0A8H4VFH8_9HYPO|nr:glutamyl-tRNA(Gln) amidotransferase subunit A [Ophiocordyceps camponoti-floridani]